MYKKLNKQELLVIEDIIQKKTTIFRQDLVSLLSDRKQVPQLEMDLLKEALLSERIDAILDDDLDDDHADTKEEMLLKILDKLGE